MKKCINVFDYSAEICKGLQKGALLTTCWNGKVNTMSIGWGHIGIEWNLPVFVAYVRESRYTRELIDQSGMFTVNIGAAEKASDIIRFCGTVSGRNRDKIREAGLTLIEGAEIEVPGIEEFPLTLECKVLYRQKQNSQLLPQKLSERFYPVEDPAGKRDDHIAYYAQIVNAYIAEK